MINDNNIYKLIKKAKDEKCNSEDPMKKIIQNPIKFVYSFTLNSNNEPCEHKEFKFFEEHENKKISSINYEYKNNFKNGANNGENFLRNQKEKEAGKDSNDNKLINNINDKSDEKDIEKLFDLKFKNNFSNKNINKKDKILSTQNKSVKINEIKDKQNKDFLNKKRININQEKKDIKDNNIKEKNIKNKKISKIVKNNIVHHLYNSKNINLWEDDDSESNKNEINIKEKKNKNILPIHKQIEFIQKSGDTFQKHNVAIKSEYDKDLDKGRMKKIHKNKIGFKKHKNYFQKISNKNIKKQNKYN